MKKKNNKIALGTAQFSNNYGVTNNKHFNLNWCLHFVTTIVYVQTNILTNIVNRNLYNLSKGNYCEKTFIFIVF